MGLRNRAHTQLSFFLVRKVPFQKPFEGVRADKAGAASEEEVHGNQRIGVRGQRAEGQKTPIRGQRNHPTFSSILSVAQSRLGGAEWGKKDGRGVTRIESRPRKWEGVRS